MRKEAVRNSLDSLLLHSEHCPIPFRTCSFQREEKSPSNSLFSVYRNDRAALPALDASPSDSSEIPAPPRRNRDESSRNPRPTRTVSPPMPPEITAEPSPRAQFPPLPFLPRNPAFRSGTAAPLRLRDTKPTLAADVRHSSPRPESSKIVRLRRQPPEKRICRIIRKPPPPATGRALRQRKNTPLPPQPKTTTHRASKSPMRKPASTGRLHPILRPTSRPTIRTIRNRPTQPHLRLATTRTRPSLPGSAEPKHALPVPPHPATSAATAASGRGKEAVTQPRDPNCAL